MGKRSGVADTEEEVAKLGLDELNVEIERCLQGADVRQQERSRQMDGRRRKRFPLQDEAREHAAPADHQGRRPAGRTAQGDLAGELAIAHHGMCPLCNSHRESAICSSPLPCRDRERGAGSWRWPVAFPPAHWEADEVHVQVHPMTSVL